jgi:hypothetical protein
LISHDSGQCPAFHGDTGRKETRQLGANSVQPPRFFVQNNPYRSEASFRNEQDAYAAGIGEQVEAARSSRACLSVFGMNSDVRSVTDAPSGAAAAHVRGLACSVRSHGGGIPALASEQPCGPVTFPFGKRDHSPTPGKAGTVVAGHPKAAPHFSPAGFGFNCDQIGSYDVATSPLAGTRTRDFLGQQAC